MSGTSYLLCGRNTWAECVERGGREREIKSDKERERGDERERGRKSDKRERGRKTEKEGKEAEIERKREKE